MLRYAMRMPVLLSFCVASSQMQGEGRRGERDGGLCAGGSCERTGPGVLALSLEDTAAAAVATTTTVPFCRVSLCVVGGLLAAAAGCSHARK